MNQYGYDGPNRHQFGGNKIPIPDSHFNPQFQNADQPRYPQMQSAPRPPRSPPPFRFSPNRNQNNTTNFSPHRGQNNNNDAQINVTFSPETYTPNPGQANDPHHARSNLVVDVLTDDMDVAMVEVRRQAEDKVTITLLNGPEMVST